MIFLLPTDTCYGLAGELNEIDYHEIYRLKGRDFSKRLTILVRDMDALREIAEISDEQIQILEQYSYPWSVVLPKKKNYILPKFLNQDEYLNISFRVALYCIPVKIQKKLKCPLFLTSANLSGNPEITTLTEARECFLGIDGYDGGICDLPPSDIFSFGVDNQLIYLRKRST